MYTPEEKQWGMLANILPLVISFFSGLGWVVSLIIYLIYKDKSRFVAFHALQSLYFQGFIFLLAVVGGLTICILIGFVIIAAAVILNVVMPILAGIAANNGELYEMPVVGKMARTAVGI